MPYISRSVLLSGCSAAMALTACGGGSSDTIVPAPTTYNLQAAYTKLITAGLTTNVALSGSVLVNGVSTAFTGTGTLVLQPGAAATFNGAMAVGQVDTIAGIIAAGGQSANYSSSVTDFFATGTDAFLGESSANEYDVAQTPFTYPTSIMGGSSGVLGTVSRYADSTMGVSLGTAQLSYMTLIPVDPGSPTSVQLIDKIYDPQNNLTETDVTSYTINANNTLTFGSATVNATSGTLTVTPN